MNNNLGVILRTRRKAKGLTLKDLSAHTGVSVSHLGRIEDGKRLPSGYILRKLAEPLSFTEIELLKLGGFMSKDETDDRMDKLKKKIIAEIIDTAANLCNKIDNL